MEITKKQFNSYVTVQESGITNMFNVSLVTDLTGLTKDQCIDIMKNYEEYSKKFASVQQQRTDTKQVLTYNIINIKK